MFQSSTRTRGALTRGLRAALCTGVACVAPPKRDHVRKAEPLPLNGHVVNGPILDTLPLLGGVISTSTSPASASVTSKGHLVSAHSSDRVFQADPVLPIATHEMALAFGAGGRQAWNPPLGGFSLHVCQRGVFFRMALRRASGHCSSREGSFAVVCVQPSGDDQVDTREATPALSSLGGRNLHKKNKQPSGNPRNQRAHIAAGCSCGWRCAER